MAKLDIKGHEEYRLDICPEVPQFRIQVDLVGQTETVSGVIVMNFEHGRYNWRYSDPGLLEELDNKWHRAIERTVIDYLGSKYGNTVPQF